MASLNKTTKKSNSDLVSELKDIAKRRKTRVSINGNVIGEVDKFEIAKNINKFDVCVNDQGEDDEDES